MAKFLINGILYRKEFTVDGIVYDIARGDLHPQGRRYDLRRQGVPGPSDMHVYIKENSSELAMEQAAKRMLGI